MALQERAIRTRATIVDAAARVFGRRGYEASSFAELIAESGLTKGAFYFHFSSKQALALATMEQKQRELMDAIAAAVPPDLVGVDRLAALLRARAAALASDESLWCVLRLGAELGSVSDPASEYVAMNEWPIRLFAGIVEEGRRTGHVRADVDARSTAETVFAAVLGMDTLALQLTAGADLAARTEHLIDLLRAALEANPTPTERTRR